MTSAPCTQTMRRQITASLRASALARRSASTSSRAQAVIVGSGPAGVTAAGTLLDAGIEDLVLVDPVFDGGRLNQRYRSVPSNTKAKTFADWATGTETFKSIISRSNSPNALDALQKLDGENECQLAYAADATLMLQEALLKDSRVRTVKGMAKAADSSKVSGSSAWDLTLSAGSSSQSISTPLLVLASGASPKALSAPSGIAPLDLDSVLNQGKLDQLGLDKSSRVAVIGSSHSAVLALKFLSDRGIPVTNFYRDDLKFAVYKEGWILYDNTGLKGDACVLTLAAVAFATEHVDGRSRWAKSVLANSQDPDLKRVSLSADGKSEDQIYAEHLPGCTHIVHAIGFTPHALPVNGQKRAEYDPRAGRFETGLYGCGIAFPEQVTDRVGNVEYAVGLFKFLRSTRRMVPEWVQESRALQWS